MICTANEELRNLFLLKRSHGLARELPTKYHEHYKKKYPEIDFNFLFLTNGYNFRNTEFNAVLGINQLPKLDQYIETRNSNYQAFTEILEPIVDLLYIPKSTGLSSFCLPFIFKKKEHRLKLQEKLLESQVEFRPIIGGNLLRQPCFIEYGDLRNFQNAEIVHNNGFYIGNNQFVDGERLSLLQQVISDNFKSDCLTPSYTHWIIGFPMIFARGLP